MDCESSVSFGVCIEPADTPGRGAIPIQMKSGVLIALLAGQPPGKSWTERMMRLGNTIKDTQDKMLFTAAQLEPLGARSSGNGWEHVRNIERTGSIYLACFH